MNHINDGQRASQLAETNRRAGLAALNALFRTGQVPDPKPDGRYEGKLLALIVAPGLTWMVARIARAWMPWRGKIFYAARELGENVFDRDSSAPARI